jgi:phosphatidylglycerophosphate synthase
MGSSWNQVPSGVERWTVLNAGAALAAAALSLACHDLRPALIVSVSALTWLVLQNVPRGVVQRVAGLGVANSVTAARMVLLCSVMACVPERGSWVAAAAFTMFALDGLDGWLAKKLGEASTFGAHFDMETDSHAVLLLDLLLIIHGGYGVWVLVAGAARYVYVLARFLAGPRELKERRSRVGRWVFSLLIVSRIVACVPSFRSLGLPLLALATLAVCASFTPDFLALRPAARRDSVVP